MFETSGGGWDAGIFTEIVYELRDGRRWPTGLVARPPVHCGLKLIAWNAAVAAARSVDDLLAIEGITRRLAA